MKRILSLVLLICVLACSFLSTAVAEEKEYTIALVPMQVGITYFELQREGAEAAAAELGNVEFIYEGPTSADAAMQATCIENLILREVDAIIIAPTDTSSLCTVLKKAIEQGIVVIALGAEMQEKEARTGFINPVNYEELGRTLCDQMAEAIGAKGKIAIISSTPTATDANEWNGWIKTQIAEKYPEMELVAIEPSDDDYDKAYSIAQNLLTAYPDLAGIIGTTSPAPPAAAQACIDRGVSGQVKVIGTAEASVMNAYLKEGAAYSAVMWDPSQIGRLGVYTAISYINGVDPHDTLEVEGYGPISLRGDEIIMASPLVMTAENVDNYNF